MIEFGLFLFLGPGVISEDKPGGRTFNLPTKGLAGLADWAFFPNRT